MTYAVVRQTPHSVARWSISGLGLGASSPACGEMRVTKISAIDDQIESCCKGIKFSGKSAAEVAHDSGECLARGVAMAAGMVTCIAAGAAVGGPVGAAAGTAIAPLCGTVAAKIGGFVYDRVSGYSAGQKVVAGIGAALCGNLSGGVCGLAAAETVGWIADKLSPVTEAIFNPGAAKERELAARRARTALNQASVKYRKQADDAMGELWSNSVSSIKQMYLQTQQSLAPASQVKLTQVLGFAPTYDGIAKAMVDRGAPSTPLSWQVSPYGEPRSTIGDRLHGRRDRADGRGCETSAAGCMDDGYSEVCPFSFNDFYMAFANNINWTGTTRDQQMGFENRMLTQMQLVAASIFDITQRAMISIVTQIMVAATALQLSDATAAASALSDAKLVVKALSAATYTEAAAQRAKSWSGSTRESAIASAENGYSVAKQARTVLTVARAPGAPNVSVSMKNQMNAAVNRAAAAAAAAHSNAAHVQIMMGVTAAAGVAGVGYLFLRK